jgi:glycosyltransferase involved in cell wall biosynthesis
MEIKSNVLYNVLENSFVKQAQQNLSIEKKAKIVLMICSLKAYKGVNEFLKLAQINPQFIFKLVVNANQNDIDNYFKNENLPSNLFVYPTQKDTHPFYKEASILLNLSDVNLWVETYGLTILEGMAYGLPAIVPPVGGVVELIQEGKNGYLIDSKKIDLITDKINELFTNTILYNKMSKVAFEKSNLFREDYFENQSFRIISK